MHSPQMRTQARNAIAPLNPTFITGVAEIYDVPDITSIDFKKMNEMAEALMMVRHPQKAEQIKEMRRKLL